MIFFHIILYCPLKTKMRPPPALTLCIEYTFEYHRSINFLWINFLQPLSACSLFAAYISPRVPGDHVTLTSASADTLGRRCVHVACNPDMGTHRWVKHLSATAERSDGQTTCFSPNLKRVYTPPSFPPPSTLFSHLLHFIEVDRQWEL